MIKDLNIKHDTIKLLGENIGKTFPNINSTAVFLGHSKEVEIKAKINKWDLIKLTSFCTAKETIKEKNLHNGRKYLQIMRPTRVSFPKYENSSYNSTTTIKTQSKTGQKT